MTLIVYEGDVHSSQCSVHTPHPEGFGFLGTLMMRCLSSSLPFMYNVHLDKIFANIWKRCGNPLCIHFPFFRFNKYSNAGINQYYASSKTANMQIHPTEQYRKILHLASNFLGGSSLGRELSHIPGLMLGPRPQRPGPGYLGSETGLPSQYFCEPREKTYKSIDPRKFCVTLSLALYCGRN